MTRVNLLWPRWAELAAHLHWKTAEARDFRALWLVRKAGALLANRYGREQAARSARISWERSRPELRELWARPPHRIRFVRNFLGLALAILFVGLGSSSPAAAGDGETDQGGRLYQALGWATFAGSAGDALSTEYAIRGGASELNPLQENRGVRIGSAVAFPLVSNYLSEELRKDGHPKLALWLRIAVVGLKGYVIVHNLRAGSP